MLIRRVLGLLPFTMLLPCTVGFLNRREWDTVVYFSEQGIKKSLASDDKLAKWYAGQFAGYATKALLNKDDKSEGKLILDALGEEFFGIDVSQISAETTANLSQIAYGLKDLARALEYMMASVNIEPENAWYNYMCGWCLAAQKNDLLALPYLDKAVLLDPIYKERIKTDVLLSQFNRIRNKFDQQ
ncbi:MAG: hypothetical protein COA75_14215 [Cellvibrionales bacterium]|nr:MAG: hypothetical protein COA75_14215 [Cellvibrionales bacterium]